MAKEKIKYHRMDMYVLDDHHDKRSEKTKSPTDFMTREEVEKYVDREMEKFRERVFEELNEALYGVSSPK